MRPVYSRTPHAAHYAGGGGHDLEQWDIKSPLPPNRAMLTALGVPYAALYHVGYLDANGAQHWTYTLQAPLTGDRCARCPSLTPGAPVVR
jgi:hypothetical protein